MIDEQASRKSQPVQVVEADVFDRMNETRELIAQRAYEIYQSRGGGHGYDQDDWFKAEGELLPKMDVDFDVSDGSVRLTAQVPGFEGPDLEVEVGHRRAIVCGVHPNSTPKISNGRRARRVMRIINLPFDVNPALSSATLQDGVLRIALPRLLQAKAFGA